MPPDPPIGFELVRQGHEPTLRDFGQTALGDFPHPIGDGADHDVAAQPRRLRARELPPFPPQILEAEGRQDSEALRPRAFAVRHSHLPRFHRALDI
jgi:hypothetical protein